MAETFHHMNEELAKRVEIKPEAASVIVAVAPCRSGTTAQLRVFAEAGAQAHYQPLKAILREFDNEDLRFAVPSYGQTVFMKETVGPYTEAESRLDPVEILLSAGLPPEKLHVVAMMRQPLATFASWIKLNDAVREYFNGAIPEDELLKNAVTSYRTVQSIREQAIASGIPTTTFVQESLRDNPPEQVVRAVLERTGLGFRETAVRGWRELTPMGEVGSGMIFHPEGTDPSHDEGAQIVHDTLLHADGLMFIPKTAEELLRRVSPEQRVVLEEAGLYDIYDSFREAAESDLGVPIRPADELELRLAS